jgi:hypothetical protein
MIWRCNINKKMVGSSPPGAVRNDRGDDFRGSRFLTICRWFGMTGGFGNGGMTGGFGKNGSSE